MTNPTDPDSAFIADTVRATGFSPATIRRSLRIGEGIIPELLDSLGSTPLASREADLLYLSFMTPAEQLVVFQLLQDAITVPATLSAILDAAGPEASLPTEPELTRRIWSDSPETERKELLTWLNREEEH